MSMDIGAFTEPDDFRAGMDAVIYEVRASRRTPGLERLCLAGKLEAETAARYVKNGIPLNDASVADFARTAEAMATDVSMPG